MLIYHTLLIEFIFKIHNIYKKRKSISEITLLVNFLNFLLVSLQKFWIIKTLNHSRNCYLLIRSKKQYIMYIIFKMKPWTLL